MEWKQIHCQNHNTIFKISSARRPRTIVKTFTEANRTRAKLFMTSLYEVGVIVCIPLSVLGRINESMLFHATVSWLGLESERLLKCE